jgi:hypothetical protein
MNRAFRSRRARFPRAFATGVAASLLAIAHGATVAAGDPDAPALESPPSAVPQPVPGATDRWLSVAALGGFTLPDRSLADYQWQIAPHGGWGAEALAGVGRLAAGMRVWTSATRQELGAPGAPATTRVSTTSWELVGRATVARVRDVSVAATASAGRIRLAYSPDRVTLASGGGAVEVVFAPIDEWVGGAGLAFQKPFGRRWRAALQLEHRVFALDTAHRAGAVIVEERSNFGDWSARVALARHTHW